MYYIDTSMLVAYYCPEPLTDQVENFLLETDRPAISILTEVELFSALSRKLRNKEIDLISAKRVAARFLEHCEGQYYHRMPLGVNHYSLAREWISQFNLPLKTLDALHLAVAACEGLTIAALDRQLCQNARKLDINTVLIEFKT
jgi:predicted nucleic acid-binding protein